MMRRKEAESDVSNVRLKGGGGGAMKLVRGWWGGWELLFSGDMNTYKMIDKYTITTKYIK